MWWRPAGWEQSRWDKDLAEAERREQFLLIYDYVKFHLGMYIAAPAIIAILGESAGIQNSWIFLTGIGIMLLIYCYSGVDATRFMATYVNTPWKEPPWKKPPADSDTTGPTRFEGAAFSWKRRFIHHWLFFVGGFAGLAGLVLAKAWDLLSS